MKVTRHFAAVSEGDLWESDDPEAIAPWAGGEPVFIRVEVASKRASRVAAVVTRIPRDQPDPVDYVRAQAASLEGDILRHFEEVLA